MPFNRLHTFLLGKRRCILLLCIIVSMPFNGLTPFLQKNMCFLVNWDSVCQCPSTGLLHFYKCIRGLQKEVDYVSMPFNGLIPFLRGYIYEKNINRKCQCPSTGLYHFYKKLLSKTDQYLKCVNALQRAYIISTFIKMTKIWRSKYVSMPFNGLIPFLRDSIWISNMRTNVSMPFNGLIPFLPCPSGSSCL